MEWLTADIYLRVIWWNKLDRHFDTTAVIMHVCAHEKEFDSSTIYCLFKIALAIPFLLVFQLTHELQET